MSLLALSHRLDALLLKARKNHPSPRYMVEPYLVVEPDWPEGVNPQAPGYEVWQRFERGEIPVRDYPGYEEHNREHRLIAQEMRVQAKVYSGFDPNEMGTES